MGRLGDHDDPREPGHDAIAGEEPTTMRRRAVRLLAHERSPRFDDLVEERTVPLRVRGCEPGRQHRHRRTLGIQRPAMGGRIDAQSAARDDHTTGRGEIEGEALGEVERLIIGRTRPDDGDGPAKAGKRPADPKRDERWLEGLKCGGELWIARCELERRHGALS